MVQLKSIYDTTNYTHLGKHMHTHTPWVTGADECKVLLERLEDSCLRLGDTWGCCWGCRPSKALVEGTCWLGAPIKALFGTTPLPRVTLSGDAWMGTRLPPPRLREFWKIYIFVILWKSVCGAHSTNSSFWSSSRSFPTNNIKIFPWKYSKQF